MLKNKREIYYFLEIFCCRSDTIDWFSALKNKTPNLRKLNWIKQLQWTVSVSNNICVMLSVSHLGYILSPAQNTGTQLL